MTPFASVYYEDLRGGRFRLRPRGAETSLSFHYIVLVPHVTFASAPQGVPSVREAAATAPHHHCDVSPDASNARTDAQYRRLFHPALTI